jgi:hypothetical protein
MSAFGGRRAGLRLTVSEAGTSLLEVVLVVALLAVVLPSAYAMVATAQQTEMITTNRFEAISSAEIVMDRVTKDLRAGVGVINTNLSPVPTQPQVFLSASPRNIVLYSALAGANGPTELHLYTPAVAGTTYDSFNEDMISANSGGNNPDYSYGSTWSPRIDDEYVAPTGAIFSFYSANGTRLDDGVDPLAASVLPSIDSIGILLVTTVNPGDAALNPLTTLSAFVHIRNVDYNPNGG